MSGIPGLGNSSGIDTATVIEGILSLRQRQIVSIEDRIARAEDEKRGFLDVNARLLSLQEVSRRLYNGTSFNASVVTSSSPTTILATGDNTAIEGTFSFSTKSLASTAQYVSSGFADTNNQKITSTPGTLTIETGDARVSRETDLDALNGHNGIDRGRLRITDDAGRTTVVDTSTAVTLNDVIDLINNNGIVQVTARTNDIQGSPTLGRGLIIENASGAGNIKVENVGFGAAATSLGIEGSSAFGAINGSAIMTLGRNTPLHALNDGRGVNTQGVNGSQLTINDSSGAVVVNLANAKTLGEIIDRINGAGGNTTAAISSDGSSVTLTDSNPPFAVTVTGTSALTTSLGFSGAQVQDAANGTLTSGPLISSINSVLLTSLGGATGVGFGGTVAAPHSFEITDSQGITTSITLDGRDDLFSVMNRINNPIGPGANVLAQLTEDGRGLKLIDKANGSADLTVTDLTGVSAQQLGIAGVWTEGETANSNLNFKHFHANMALTEFGFDVGPQSGSIELTLRNGQQFRVDISLVTTVGGLVDALNSVPSITANVNSTGDGIAINDLTGGTGPMVIKDVSGTFARRLGIRGTFGGTGIVNARKEYEIEVGVNDTMNDVVSKIRGLGVPVVASTIDDGGRANNFRLSITGEDSGKRNDVIVTSDIASLRFGQTSTASDAVLLYGDSTGSADPVVLRSTTNSFKRVITGVTIDVLQLSNNPVTVTINRDLQAAANDVTELVDTFNALAGRLDELTGYNVDTQTAGPLLADGTLSGLEFVLKAALLDPVKGLPNGFNTLAAIGIDISNDGTFEVDQTKLLDALTNRLREVEDVFANIARLDPDTDLARWNNGQGIKQVDGDDLRISFRDGSADLAIDFSGRDRLKNILDLLNADPRLSAEISSDGKRLIIRDQTTGPGTFAIRDVNNSGTISSLGLSRSEALPGSDRLETKDIRLDSQLGVARIIDREITQYTQNEGLIERATDSIDERVKRFNEDIGKVEERIQRERERLEKQFQAMEAALSESQSSADVLNRQFESLNNSRRNN